MFTLLIVLIALIGIVMTLLILLQSGKGGGLAGIAAGGTTQILGARQAPDVLEKGSWFLGAVFLVLCVLTNFVITDEQRGSVLQDRVLDAPVEQTVPLAPPPAAAGGADAASGDGN
ncbi:MAG: hypothetical protein RhofKO_24890 [Rhodothermales bacterium]